MNVSVYERILNQIGLKNRKGTCEDALGKLFFFNIKI